MSTKETEIDKFGRQFRLHLDDCSTKWLNEYFQKKNGKTFIQLDEAVTVMAEFLNLFFGHLKALDAMDKNIDRKKEIMEFFYKEISERFADIMNEWTEK